MKKYLLLVFIFFCNSLNAQKITGILLDKITNKPIPFVSIVNETENKTTVTNEEGKFEISVSKIPVKLNISHVSYKKGVVELTEYKDYVLKLEENIIELSEIIIGNNASTLLDLAIKKARKDSSFYHYQKVFFQKIAKEGGATKAIHEIFFDAAWDSYGIKLWNPTNARYAQKKSHHTFSNITTFAFFLSGTISKNRDLPNNIFENKENYKYSIFGTLNERSNDEIIIIKLGCTNSLKNFRHF